MSRLRADPNANPNRERLFNRDEGDGGDKPFFPVFYNLLRRCCTQWSGTGLEVSTKSGFEGKTIIRFCRYPFYPIHPCRKKILFASIREYPCESMAKNDCSSFNSKPPHLSFSLVKILPNNLLKGCSRGREAMTGYLRVPSRASSSLMRGLFSCSRPSRKMRMASFLRSEKR